MRLHVTPGLLATTSYFAAAMLALSCGSAATVGGTGGAGAQSVLVTVSPASATLVPSESLQFNANVTGTANTSVTWSVVETGGGTINASGLYTAPAAAGTFHVRVASQASPQVFVQATLVVTASAPVAVAISPKSASLLAGGTTTFTATVTGSTNPGVTWSLAETSGCGSITQNGVYTAPAAAATCEAVVTSVADPTKSDRATITVTVPPVVTVAVSPPTGTVDGCTTLTLSATVTGSTDTTVVWSVAEGSAGGAVSSAGVYTAPATAGTYHVVATSHANPAESARATVTVVDHILSVAVNPSNTAVSTGGTVQFAATITTSCGTFAATAAD